MGALPCVAGGVEAAKQGHYAIMTPTAPLYLDYYQSRDTQNEPLAIGGYNPVDMVYNFNPIPESLTEEQAKFILGTQANIWTEYITTPEHLEYMILPRLAALSEVQWDQVENKSYDRFLDNIGQCRHHVSRKVYFGNNGNTQIGGVFYHIA